MTLLTILPVSLSADDTADRALLQSTGGVLVDNRSAPPSIAVFPGNTVETAKNRMAVMNYDGSSVQVGPETVIRLGHGEIMLDHGSVTVTSVRQLRVRAGCVVATPAARAETIYSVKDTDNRVTVIATRKDVDLDSRSGGLKRAHQPQSSQHAVVHEGNHDSREEHCGAGDLWTPVHATGPILDSPYAVGGASALVGGGTLCILKCFGDDPASSRSPSKSSVTSNHP